MKKIFILIFSAALFIACNDKKTESHEGHDHSDATHQHDEHEGHDHSGDATAKDSLSSEAHNHEHTEGDGHQH